jgi:hypothetical protein
MVLAALRRARFSVCRRFLLCPLALELSMRRSLALASSSFLTVFALSAAALVACGGETASLGSQGDDVKAGGSGGDAGSGSTAGNAGTGGSTAGAGGSEPGNCATIDITCKENETKVLDLNGCQSCMTCPAVTEFAPDGCPNGIEPRYGADGCQVGWKCQDPTPDCPDPVLPPEEACPSGGWSPTFQENGCMGSYECIKCPVVGDPSFCADGTIVVAIKDGKCDYQHVACKECGTADPPEPSNWCNDGVRVSKDADGLCLTAPSCSCPDQAPCPPNSGNLPIPGSFCGLFVCNDVACGTPPQPTETCTGKFVWERDLKGCATKAVCQPQQP